MPYPYPILDRDLWPKRGAAPHVKNVVCNGRAQKKTLTKILAKIWSRIAKNEIQRSGRWIFMFLHYRMPISGRAI